MLIVPLVCYVVWDPAFYKGVVHVGASARAGFPVGVDVLFQPSVVALGSGLELGPAWGLGEFAGEDMDFSVMLSRMWLRVVLSDSVFAVVGSVFDLHIQLMSRSKAMNNLVVREIPGAMPLIIESKDLYELLNHSYSSRLYFTFSLFFSSFSPRGQYRGNALGLASEYSTHHSAHHPHRPLWHGRSTCPEGSFPAPYHYRPEVMCSFSELRAQLRCSPSHPTL